MCVGDSDLCCSPASTAARSSPDPDLLPITLPPLPPLLPLTPAGSLPDLERTGCAIERRFVNARCCSAPNTMTVLALRSHGQPQPCHTSSHRRQRRHSSRMDMEDKGS